LPISTDLATLYAHIFFIDVVGLSNPMLSTKTQIKKIKALNRCILDCNAYKLVSPDLTFVLPTGDGMVIGFINGIELPLHLAIQVHQKLAEYNQPKIPSEVVKVRIGLHSGNVFVVEDIQHNKNVWGPGTIIARRIMDFGDENHILLSSRMAEDLLELSDEYRRIIHPMGNVKIKHGQTITVYSAFGAGFGNPNTPLKKRNQDYSLRRKGDPEQALPVKFNMQKPSSSSSLYSYVEVALTLKDLEKMLMHYRRTYEVINISNKPIESVFHGITTDFPKSFDQLNLRIYDQDNNNLSISSIRMDEPYQKEFITAFQQPILSGQNLRYTLEYDIEEPNRYFENAFLTDCKKFVIIIEYPNSSSAAISPIIYDVNQETEEKKKLMALRPLITGNSCIARWSNENVVKGQTFRIEW